ncbi:amidohydrolase [Paenibacillus oryzisoli]|uniref:amidohydrolase n=1 Tax=Paenibacillus oryzisoli TaxID=1850517 RepID=UPI003D282B24
MHIFEADLQAVYEEMVEWRRYLHRHPELSYQEVETAKFVANHLRNWGIEVRTGVGGNGVVGLLRGGSAGPTVALRADMDALPIQDEKTGCAYGSTRAGIMHACGHDAHTSTLLAIAKVTRARREEIKGNLVFLFQHAEEISPGGANSMIEAGALEGVDAVYGVHLWTPFPVGHVYTRPGAFMAAPDEFAIRIQGKGGHGGLPHQTIDSVYIASQLVVNLQGIVSRQVDPIESCVVSVGAIHGGTSFNVIAESCALSGTVRTFNPALREEVRARIERITHATCEMSQASYELDYKLGYPTVVNDAQEAQRFTKVGAALFGEDRVHESPPIMAGEDFSYYLQHKPGCFMFVGAGNVERGIVHPHHHPKFDIDEASMLNAANLLIGMALDYMANN